MNLFNVLLNRTLSNQNNIIIFNNLILNQKQKEKRYKNSRVRKIFWIRWNNSENRNKKKKIKEW